MYSRFCPLFNGVVHSTWTVFDQELRSDVKKKPQKNWVGLRIRGVLDSKFYGSTVLEYDDCFFDKQALMVL